MISLKEKNEYLMKAEFHANLQSVTDHLSITPFYREAIPLQILNIF
jgi:hypothetical protein